MVEVAQLAEHRIVTPSVAGSTPVFHPIRRITQEAEGVCLENREAGDEPVRGFKSYILRHMPE